MKNEIKVTVKLPDGTTATFEVPNVKADGTAVEQAAKYMLKVCGWKYLYAPHCEDFDENKSDIKDLEIRAYQAMIKECKN